MFRFNIEIIKLLYMVKYDPVILIFKILTLKCLKSDKNVYSNNPDYLGGRIEMDSQDRCAISSDSDVVFNLSDNAVQYSSAGAHGHKIKRK